MNPKRRWTLAIVAIVVVAGVVGLIVFREDPKQLGRLLIVSQEAGLSNRVVRLRFEPLNNKQTMIGLLRLRDGTGAVLDFRPEEIGPRKWGVLTNSFEVSVMLPSSIAAGWFVEASLWERTEGFRMVLTRAKLCLQFRSLRPWRETKVSHHRIGWVKSGPITNVVPHTADAPAR